ncbi:MAG TPA: nicotinate-nucleotide--dimethylbenzimidazole phosphoribosyltransferase [Candidatus Dormibacteraeota bacterium]|nr:nicotinate-nucleotide--dimethylbenzimidazole phosphoribosyltransferase [Candidatus Dormibacteraeota bacterium]
MPSQPMGEGGPTSALSTEAVVLSTEASFTDEERRFIYRLMGERRDIRHFRPDPVPEEVLWRVLWAGHHAGSVGFMQPWDFIVVRDLETRRRLRDSAERQRQAAALAMREDPARADRFAGLKVEGILECGVVVVVTVDPTRGGNHVLGRYSDLESDIHSACCAVQNMWLAARAEGLGMGWVSFFHPGEVQQALGIPPHVRPLAILCLGWPEAFPARPLLEAIGWERRRPLRALVHQERWGAVGRDPVSPAVPAITPPDQQVMEVAARRQEQLTKPAGSLGALEEVAVRLAGMTGTLTPKLAERVVFVLAADHGVAEHGVSAYPKEVTGQMVLNFLRGGAAVNVLARQHGARVVVADLGVDAKLPQHPDLVSATIRPGTWDITRGPAMTREEAVRAVEMGRALVRQELLARGLDLALTGDMGIANTTSAAALICALTGLDPRQVVGRGTGVDDVGLERKRQVVRTAVDVNRTVLDDPLDALAALGGFEIAGLVGVILEAAAHRRPVLLDGFVSGAAALVAVALEPNCRHYLIAGHRSQELGHAATLAALGLRPLLDLELRLGEGSGALLALPLVEASVRLLAEMATFAEAGVSERTP